MRSTKLLEKNKHLFETELQFSKEERGAFLHRVREFTQFKEDIYRAKRLKEVSDHIGALVEAAGQFALQETGEWFDKNTVNRHVKEMQNSYKVFQKTCNEITVLQQRLEACYEDIGSRLKTYYEI
jgi:histidinol dehydrogenase